MQFSCTEDVTWRYVAQIHQQIGSKFGHKFNKTCCRCCRFGGRDTELRVGLRRVLDGLGIINLAIGRLGKDCRAERRICKEHGGSYDKKTPVQRNLMHKIDISYICLNMC